jgi:UTP--glucose-1-phosphate uridylyltransferase
VTIEPVRVAVIPAAGLGTRFLPVTKTVPKEMLPLVDRPIIDVVIGEAVAAGVEEVVVVSAPGKAPLDGYFRPHQRLEARLAAEGRERDLELARRGQRIAKRVTLVHQEEPLGNGHAVLCAREAVGRRPFVMIWGDDVVLGDPGVAAQLARTRERLGGGSVAAVMRVSHETVSRYGAVEGEAIDERTWRVRRLIEKPRPEEAPSRLAQVHGYVFEPEIFDELERTRPGKGGEIWLADAVNALAQRAPVFAYEFTGERFDAGDRGEYVRAVVAAALARPELAGGLADWLRVRISDKRHGA